MYRNYIKRVIDFFSVFIILLLIWPILLFIGIGLYFANKGTGVFFFQERPGRNGKIFKVIKFKSMTDEKDENGNLLPNEKRITLVGALIRKTSIDELPQLFNVLKGDMALVGPRPLRIDYLPLYTKEQARRHDVRPGITGWAQVNGRNTISWTKKFDLDIWYVDHLTFLLDLKIIYFTVMKVIKRSDINSGKENIGIEKFNGYN